MKEFIKISLNEFKALRFYALISLGVTLLTYSIFFIDKEAFHRLNFEDGLVENLTALCLLITSLCFLKLFFMTRNMINLLFCVAFMFGCGEEISWGQRLLNFETPESVMTINRQGEFNIHNLSIFNATNEKGAPKPILKRIMNPGALFILFGFSYLLLYPFLFNGFRIIRIIGQSIGLLTPPLLFGLLFLTNYLIYKFVGSFTAARNVRFGESFEFIAVFLFAFLALYFVRNFKAVAVATFRPG